MTDLNVRKCDGMPPKACDGSGTHRHTVVRGVRDKLIVYVLCDKCEAELMMLMADND
jgi:hypothetical protein